MVRTFFTALAVFVAVFFWSSSAQAQRVSSERYSPQYLPWVAAGIGSAALTVSVATWLAADPTYQAACADGGCDWNPGQRERADSTHSALIATAAISALVAVILLPAGGAMSAVDESRRVRTRPQIGASISPTPGGCMAGFSLQF